MSSTPELDVTTRAARGVLRGPPSANAFERGAGEQTVGERDDAANEAVPGPRRRPRGAGREEAAPLLRAAGLHKSYRKANTEVPVLRGVDFEIRPGQFTAVVGQSGSGKSTLLHLLATLDAPDQGEIHYDQRRIDNLPPRARDRLRNRDFGMIFQFYHLLPELSALENVLSPLMITHGVAGYFWRKREFADRAKELLEMVGLGHRARHRPRELSGGEMQRAAIARALIAEPRLLLADEPTGNLDSRTGRDILAILRSLNVKRNLTIIMVTHDPAIAAQADNIVRLVEGRVQHLEGHAAM